MEDITQAKVRLRGEMSVWRQTLKLEEVLRQSAILCDLLIEFVRRNDNWFRARTQNKRPVIALYNAFRREADFAGAWSELQSIGWDLAFPIVLKKDCDNSRQMVFVSAPVPIEEKWFSRGHFGVMEPPYDKASIITPDIIIMPGLAFDMKGGRLGWGKAYYDTYLASMNHSYVTIAAALEGQIVEQVPVAEHDQPVDAILTISGVKKTIESPIELVF
jgi:5-formyltetrahydrofolate cyclo-ligase